MRAITAFVLMVAAVTAVPMWPDAAIAKLEQQVKKLEQGVKEEWRSAASYGRRKTLGRYNFGLTG